MPRVCTVCQHKARDELDAALVAGESLRTIADRWSVSKTALIRHKAEHMPAHLAKAKEAAEVVQADNLLEQVRSLQARAHGILDKAEAAGDLKTALSAIREARGNLELLAKLLGELQQEGAAVNITVNAEWLSLRAIILQALAPHPKALEAILGALSDT